MLKCAYYPWHTYYFIYSMSFLQCTYLCTRWKYEPRFWLPKTILLLIMLSFTFWLPYGVLINTALDLTNHPKPSTSVQYVIKIVLVSVFESQYAINYFIYVARHEQYRNALLDVLPFSGRGRKRSSQRNQRTINN